MVRTHTECKEIDKKGNVGNNKFTDKNKTGECKKTKMLQHLRKLQMKAGMRSIQND